MICLSSVSKVSFDLERSPNRLVPLIFHDDTSVKRHIGYFGRREEAMYELSNEHSSIFAFVVNGAFEIQGRLLHKGDGLALWDAQEADIEALSENAVLLIIENN